LEELQQAVRDHPRSGYHKHHIVERKSAEDDGFPRWKINSSDNLASVPRLKHEEITAWFQTKNPIYNNMSPRDYLRGKDWETRRKVGLEALIDRGVLKP
jgi:hypothetical protein